MRVSGVGDAGSRLERFFTRMESTSSRPHSYCQGLVSDCGQRRLCDWQHNARLSLARGNAPNNVQSKSMVEKLSWCSLQIPRPRFSRRPRQP